MKKFLIILALTLLQCACATQGAAPRGSVALISFEAISAEIKVGFEQTEAADDLAQTLALNTEK